ncbi:hypothetical protein FJY90_07330 [Candidatus Gottesmanbacteria bacterium]|nr:hypothetical protein [Candidatus Gottesmanbacteria bacterium]
MIELILGLAISGLFIILAINLGGILLGAIVFVISIIFKIILYFMEGFVELIEDIIKFFKQGGL